MIEGLIERLELQASHLLQNAPHVPAHFAANIALALCALYDEQRKRRVQDALIELSKHADMPQEIAEILGKLL